MSCWRRRSPAFEVGCAVLGSEELTVGLVDEIQLSGGFFDFEEKYTLKTSAIHCPARIPPEAAARVQEAARTIFRALDCRGFARGRPVPHPEGALLFNEVNTIPGFTPPQPLSHYDAGRRPGLHLPGQPHDPAGGGSMRPLRLRREQTCQGPLVLIDRAHPPPGGAPPELVPVDRLHPQVLLERRAARLLAACIRSVGAGGPSSPSPAGGAGRSSRPSGTTPGPGGGCLYPAVRGPSGVQRAPDRPGHRPGGGRPRS